jgi:acyl-CoA synthetase (AMP-forming)/AMP-acid ligase II/acyl carrier protein
VVRLEGDQASPRDVELYRAHCPDDCVLVNGLGATECGLVRQYFVDKHTVLSGPTVPIGGPVEDMEVVLLGETADRAAPEGVSGVGEIAVRSRYLAEGYWRRPDLTAAAFVPDPAGSDVRTYRTGDLGRFSADGSLEHVGRMTFERKIRGQRVDVAGIEAALLGLPGVHEAIAVTRDAESRGPDGLDEPRLVAYVVPVAGATLTVTAMRGQLARHFPDAMVPTTWVLLDSLPLTSDGKVDRRALPAPGRSRPQLDVAMAAPVTPIEATLVAIWCEVLELEPIGVHDHFLDLGGDSLLATQVTARVRDRLGVELPVSALFEEPTVAGLASVVERYIDGGIVDGTT